jgi:hypothetical protein
MGGGRVLIMDSTMILDFFHLLNNREIFDAAKTSALKRKVTNPFFKGVDFSNPENWSLVLREMEIMGWGKFKLNRDTIEVESCILPRPYLKGYFEGMFGGSFESRHSKTTTITSYRKKNPGQSK